MNTYKKINKKLKKIVKKIFILLCIPVMIPILTNLLNRFYLRPSIWTSDIQADALKTSLESFNYPQYIHLNSIKEDFIVTNDEIYFEIGINNNFEHELILSNIQLEIEQYNIDYPNIETKLQRVDDEYFVEIHNLSNDNIENLIINLTDKDKIFDKALENNTKDVNLLEGNGYKCFKMFEINELKEQSKAYSIFPVLKIIDDNKNIIEYEFDEIVLYPDFNPTIPAPLTGEINEFYYDITDDIKQHNNIINFYKYKYILPSYNGMLISYNITSEVPCAIKISISFKLNNKIYRNDIGNIIFYNPTNNEIKHPD